MTRFSISVVAAELLVRLAKVWKGPAGLFNLCWYRLLSIIKRLFLQKFMNKASSDYVRPTPYTRHSGSSFATIRNYGRQCSAMCDITVYAVLRPRMWLQSICPNDSRSPLCVRVHFHLRPWKFYIARKQNARNVLHKMLCFKSETGLMTAEATSLEGDSIVIGYF
jgi:hypothetical protein